METDTEPDRIFRHLKKSRYLKNIEDKKLYKLAHIARMQKWAKGNILLRQNEKNQEVYILVKGSVSVFMDKELIYTLNRTGDIFGEMSVITSSPSDATITADQDIDLIRVPSLELQGIHSDQRHELHSALYQWFSNILSDKLNQTSQKAKQYESVSRKLRNDLEDAKATQDKIFTACTQPIPGFPLSMKSEYSHILGGDFYGVFPIDKIRYGILIGDVSGHGTGACLISMMIFNLFQTNAPDHFSAKSLVEMVNTAALPYMHQGKFTTVFYAVYDTESRGITYTNAGHHPALVLRREEVIVLPPTSGIPIGIFSTDLAQYSEETFTFIPDDRLILFTDAVFDMKIRSRSETGLDRIIHYIRSCSQADSRGLVKGIYKYTKALNQSRLNDDFTLMIFEQN